MAQIVCPLCGADSNSSGNPFVSEWALACHVAGSIQQTRDILHRSWYQKKFGAEPVPRSIPRLAEKLLLDLHKEGEKAPTVSPSPTPLNALHDAETQLHGHIRKRLQEHFGSDGEEWWVGGVPLKIRQECAARREADPARGDPYGYTYLIDLCSIIDKNWAVFDSDFRALRDFFNSKRDFLECLGRLNDARNRYAHPVRAPGVGSPEYEADLAFTQQTRKLVGKFCGT
jgi:hypothetical protein